MKIRHGFVSNSSSSSFVVGFKCGIEVEDLLRAWWIWPHSATFCLMHQFAEFLSKELKQKIADKACNWILNSPADYRKKFSLKHDKNGEVQIPTDIQRLFDRKLQVVFLSASWNDDIDDAVEAFLGNCASGSALIDCSEFVLYPRAN